jgi:hypothetical protein
MYLPSIVMLCHYLRRTAVLPRAARQQQKQDATAMATVSGDLPRGGTKWDSVVPGLAVRRRQGCARTAN